MESFRRRPDAEQIEPLLGSKSEDSAKELRLAPWRRSTIAILLVVILAAVDSGLLEIVVPLIRVYEGIVCHNHFMIHDPGVIVPGTDLPEEMCKIEPVQSQLAFIRGYEAFFMTVPSLLLAVPYGLLADRWGRKPVLLMSVLGLLLAITSVLVVCWFPQIFPLRLVWLAWAMTLIGGGAPVGLSMVMTMIADIVKPSQRTHMFFQIAIGLLITQVCATSLAAAIMKYRSAWVAICVGYVSITVASCFTLILPETTQYRSEADPEESSKSSVNERHEDIGYAGEGSMRRRLRYGRLFLTESFGFLLKDWKVLAILVTFFVNTIGNAVLSIGVQYISARFGWAIAEANLLFSFRSAVNAILFIFLLPGITWVLDKKYHMTTMNRDLRLAKASVIFLPLGLFVMAFAGNISSMTTGLVIMTLGTGYSSLMRSFVTSIFERQHIARLYSAITIFETLGSMFSGPMLAGLFQWGIHLGGMWQGMPFFAAGLMALLTAVLAWTMPVLSSQRSQCSAEGGEIEEELNRRL